MQYVSAIWYTPASATTSGRPPRPQQPCGAHQYLQWWHWPLLVVYKALTAIFDSNYSHYCDMSQISHEICRLRPDLISSRSHRRRASCVCVHTYIWHPMFKPHSQPAGVIRTRREWNSMENGDFGQCCDRVTLKGPSVLRASKHTYARSH